MIILDTYSVCVGVRDFSWLMIVGSIVVLLASIVIIACLKKWNSLIPLFIGVLLAGVVLFIFGCAFKGPTLYETRYVVTFNDDICVNEAFKNYDIIEKQGKLWILKDINETPYEEPKYEVR